MLEHLIHARLLRARLLGACGLLALGALTAGIPAVSREAAPPEVVAEPRPPVPDESPVAARLRADVAAMETFRPGYPFWQHVFTIPDGNIAFGSAADGRLLAVFPAHGNWTRQGEWTDPALAHLLDGQPLARRVLDRREQVARLLEPIAGPVVHNSTRGRALLPNVDRYGRFLAEWAAIYERFGVPAEIGIAQAIFESGLNGTRRSEANAIGFCQWLRRNWQRLNGFAPIVIEGQNQTTQAPYCAAYLSVLATRYGSFIPALSEHNAGGTNVGRTLIVGEQLGAEDVRARYLLGAQLALDLRSLPGRTYWDVHRTYGPRSYLYAEMVFGNRFNVEQLMASTPQVAVHAMRTSRAISLAEIVERTGLPADEVRRFNPALTRQVPARSTLYLPFHVDAFGDDVAFWRRPASPAYAAVLDDFLRIEADHAWWDDPASAPVLRAFQDRFRATGTEEGTIMATTLAYAMDQAYTSGRRDLLEAFRQSERVRQLIARGVRELDPARGLETAPRAASADRSHLE